MRLAHTTVASPVGPLHLVAGPRGLCLLAFADWWEDGQAWLGRRFGALELAPGRVEAAGPLCAYLGGALDAIDAIDVDLGGTEFQAAVWRALRRIPAGTTTSYGELARAIGAPAAVRAVGAANGANPVAIVVPCHRVVASTGKLHGYGGGLDRKRWLLDHERATGVQPALL
jgi:methylated-DNA-[protein]-cysteine S-methyltransferase